MKNTILYLIRLLVIPTIMFLFVTMFDLFKSEELYEHVLYICLW